LREVTRDLQQTKDDLGVSANRLWEQVHRYYAPLLALCAGADEPWLWELLGLAPTPAKGRGLHLNTIRKLLQRHRLRRFTPEALRQVLHQAALPVAPGVAEIAAQKVGLLIARLQLLHTQRLGLENQQKTLLAKLEAAPPPPQPPATPPDSEGAHFPQNRQVLGGAGPAQNQNAAPPSDAAILRSLPGVGAGVSATLLSEAGALLGARDLTGLRGLTGIAAVTRQSGKSRQVVMRRACNLRLRNAMHYWASTSVQNDAHLRAIYQRLRASGKSYARALRGLGDHLLRILVSALRSRTLYDKMRWPENQATPEAAAVA
jgi:transposase